MVLVTARTVGIMGLGRMGLTLAAGFSRAVEPARLFVAGRSVSSIERVRAAVPTATVLPPADLADRATLVVLCVRNVDLPDVLAVVRPRLSAEHIVVTINNALPLSRLADSVPCPVAKLIPSVGNEIGAGATLLMPGPGLSEDAVAELTELLQGFSRPFVIDERQGRAATDLASCGPALLASVAQSMIAAQIERGAPLPPGLAEQLLAQSIDAVSRLLDHGTPLAEIVDRVAVPGGNTAAAVEASRDGLAAAWRAAFWATADNERSKPLPAL
ncbi:pyrroline-5-carboxylate reductase family protein [Streptosporangium sandarakinum]|uniref:pyrroline-5-carboxylate reductase family protein n=1 Tax=Streptosporangium sandarakinum TaxID=1260955 RepID=UPI00379F1834